MKQSQSELTSQDVAHLAVKGLAVLISRSVFIQLISTVGFLLLTAYLLPAEIGLFFGVSEIIGVLGYFSDVGLAASLIQSKKQVTLAALRTSFTIQQLIVLTLSIGLWLGTPWVAQYYNFDSQEIFLLHALIIAFILSSLKTIPSVLLERELQFSKLVIVETVETLAFYVVALCFALNGYGATSYAYAVLARGILGVVTMYLISPWQIGLAWHPDELKTLLNFGLPYQGNTLIAAIKDRFLNLFLFKFIGASGMGILGWAQIWSQKPLRFISDNVTKVTFPAFSRLQDHPEALSRAIDRMLFFSAITIFPVLIGAGVVIGPLTDLIPQYQKWQPGLFAFYLYLFNSGWAAISTPLTNTLASLGHIKSVTKLMVMWTVLTWVIIAPLAMWWGYNGAAIGVAIVACSSIVPMLWVKKLVSYHPWQSLGPGLISSVIMGLITFACLSILPSSWWSLICSIIIGAVVYVTILYTSARSQLRHYQPYILKLLPSFITKFAK